MFKKLKAYLLPIIVFMIYAPNAQADDPSCVHGLHNLAEIQQLDVKSVRWIITDKEIQSLLNNPEGQAAKTFQLVRKLTQDNINIILTLRFPEQQGETMSNRVQKDRVPQGQDRAQTLKLVGRFLTKAGPYLAAVQFNNEPAGGPGYYDDNDIKPVEGGKSESILWLEDLSGHIKNLRRKPELSHIKLIGPALTGVAEYLDGKAYPPLRVQYIKQLITFSDEHMDFLDIHMHVRDLEQIEKTADYVRQYTDIPFVALEWSQSKSTREWLSETVSADVSASGKTNREFLESTYKDKVSAETWQAFVMSAPLDPAFIPRSYQYLKEAGFAAICYSPAVQYGDPDFDLVNLFVPRSVRPTSKAMPRNDLIYDTFFKTISVH